MKVFEVASEARAGMYIYVKPCFLRGYLAVCYILLMKAKSLSSPPPQGTILCALREVHSRKRKHTSWTRTGVHWRSAGGWSQDAWDGKMGGARLGGASGTTLRSPSGLGEILGRYLCWGAARSGLIFRQVTLPETLGESKKGKGPQRRGTGCCDPSRILPPKMSLT